MFSETKSEIVHDFDFLSFVIQILRSCYLQFQYCWDCKQTKTEASGKDENLKASFFFS